MKKKQIDKYWNLDFGRKPEPWIYALPSRALQLLLRIGIDDPVVIKKMIESGEIDFRASSRRPRINTGYGRLAHIALVKAVGADVPEVILAERKRCSCCGQLLPLDPSVKQAIREKQEQEQRLENEGPGLAALIGSYVPPSENLNP
jgi:hypothetical protein